jgi:YfiH family protein
VSPVEAVVVEEVLDAGDVPLWRQPEWGERFPWLVQGVTGAGDADEPFDLGLFGEEPVGRVLDRWERLRAASGMRRVVHARQVHGAELRAHGAGEEQGILIGTGYDGHLTRAAGLLLTVSIADCVPVFVVDADARAVAVVHAGWRGVAAGIVERAIERLRGWRGDGGGELWLHCGPAICGRCYEVGPEVHAAVRPDEEPPPGPTPIDLRAEIVRRGVARDVAPERSTVSVHCTRCGPGAFFSHRGGSAARQMAILGIRG